MFKYNNPHIDLKFLSGRNRVSLWEKFLHLLWLRDQYWRKQEVKDFQCIYFSTHYSISNLLLTHLWTIYVDFVLIEVNTDCYRRSFDCVLPSLNKIHWYLSTISRKYWKWVIEIIRPHSFSLFDYSFFVVLLRKNFEK